MNDLLVMVLGVGFKEFLFGDCDTESFDAYTQMGISLLGAMSLDAEGKEQFIHDVIAQAKEEFEDTETLESNLRLLLTSE